LLRGRKISLFAASRIEDTWPFGTFARDVNVNARAFGSEKPRSVKRSSRPTSSAMSACRPISAWSFMRNVSNPPSVTYTRTGSGELASPAARISFRGKDWMFAGSGFI
jgi:hypothetical protein